MSKFGTHPYVFVVTSNFFSLPPHCIAQCIMICISLTKSAKCAHVEENGHEKVCIELL